MLQPALFEPHVVAAVANLVAAPPVAAAQTLPQVIDNATNWVRGIMATVATFFMALGALQYTSAGGDPAAIERAKGAFKAAGGGYALAVLSPMLLNVLKSILGG